MRVIQLINGIDGGTGVANSLFSLVGALEEIGYKNEIYAKSIGEIPHGWSVKKIENLEDLNINSDTVMFYHFLNGCDLNEDVKKLDCKKILVFQNVTPPAFFYEWNRQKYCQLTRGEYEARNTVGYYDFAIAPSMFSRNQLVSYGWNPSKVAVIPLINVNYDFVASIGEEPNANYSNCSNVFLHVGRIVPNKKIEDIILIFNEFVTRYDEKAYLILCGDNNGYQLYYKALLALVKKLNLKDKILFTGQVLDAQVESYYKRANVYLCMSEHEGLCIPILEAFKHKIPVIAYYATAVPDTMGDAGVIVHEKNFEKIAGTIHDLLNDKTWLDDILKEEQQRVNSFSISKYKSALSEIVNTEKSMTRTLCNSELANFKKNVIDDELKLIEKWLEAISEKNPDVYIYGAGMVATRLVRVINMCNIQISVKGFLVQSLCNNPFQIFGIKVFEVGSIQKCSQNIIIGISLKQQNQLYAELSEKFMDSTIYMITPEIYNSIISLDSMINN